MIEGRHVAIRSITRTTRSAKLLSKGIGHYCDALYKDIERMISKKFYDTIVCEIVDEVDITTLLSALQLRDKYKGIAVIAVLDPTLSVDATDNYRSLLSRANLTLLPTAKNRTMVEMLLSVSLS